MGLFERMLRIDRRWIFLFVGVSVSVPLFLKLDLKIDVTPETRGIYEAVEAIPPGSKVILAADYDPGTAAELQPMAVTFLKHALGRGLRVIVVGLWPQGPQQADLALAEAMREPGVAARRLVYGVDWINLGYQSGNEVVIQRMGSNIPAIFPRDYRGRPLAEFPIMGGVTDLTAIAYIFNVSAGDPGTLQWVQFAGDRFHVAIGSGSTAVQAPQVYPYWPQQLTGLLGGMKGAAEYEAITGFRGKGTVYMLSQAAAHLVVILFIIVGNAAYIVTRRRRPAGGAA
jgi:hypothetical protein